MKKSLVYKIQIRIVSILSLSLVILGIILSILGIDFLKDQRKELINKEVYPITVEVSNYLRVQENTSLSNLKNTMEIVSKCTSANIIITDNLGYPYAVSTYLKKDEELKLSEKVITENERIELKEGNILEKVEGENWYVYMKPIFQDNYFGGILIFKISTKAMQIKVTWLLISIWMCIFISIIIMLIGIRHYIKDMIIEPIGEINKVAKKIAIGEVDKRVAIVTNDEIGDLAKSFNLMAETLNKIDENRRNFISNASHELRSPIMSICGFIAGIIDGVIPKGKERYYLEIVYDEIKRLCRLVNDLLDISTLDSSNYKLNEIEDDINAIIKACLVKQQNKIIDKDLKVEVTLENDHEFVLIDRDRIIQVLTNLLDNAIKYSYIGEVVKIKTKVKGEKVYVSIENKGDELSETQILKVWDRFYKADSSRTNKESTGLGLSIVRTIISRHGEDIWVESVDGKTVFTFTLTRIM
ncbi:MAG: HAMP domain-containing histidine kinase [Clostridium sp.]|nr:HAMP domain-containing histidine kinase [Clostridium sp.]